ncbi:MAG: FkbM family methyltransferase [Rhodospirillaceae bacterium]
MKSTEEYYNTALNLRNRADYVQPNDLQSLLQKPTFSGFVSASVGPSLSFEMFICEGDDLVAARLFWRGHFEPMSSQLWAKLCKGANVACDIGSHSGYYSLLANQANPNLIVWSFEPHPIVYSRLLINIRANKLSANHCINKAIVADKNPTASLYVNSAHWAITSGSSLLQRAGYKINVATQFIGTLVSQNQERPTLIKIDVEGIEEELINALAFCGYGSVSDILTEQLEPWSQQTNSTLTTAGWTILEIDESAMSITNTFGRGRQDSSGESRNIWLTRRDEASISEIVSSFQQVYERP